MESILTQSEESKAFTKDLCFEFAYEAATLRHWRSKALSAPHYTLSDLLELDNRLEAQIDALRVAGEPGWEECKALLSKRRAEYFFAPSLLAFESGDENRIALILEQAAAKPAAAEGVVSAVAWMPYEQAKPHIEKLLFSKIAVHQTIGIAASAFHRKDPGGYLENAFYATDAKLKACSLKAVGELGGRGDMLMPGRLRNQFQAAEPACRFWAAWSLLLLGDASALDPLIAFARNPSSPLQEEALQLVLRKMDLKSAQALHQELTKKTDAQRLAVIGAGVIADPSLIPWLINQMDIPALARLAGEALTTITGVNVVDQELEGSWPEGFEAGPNDDPNDPNVEPDPDENLPWPDAPKVSAWWDKNKNNFKPGERCLLGKPITKEHLQTVLQTGLQRQRIVAALELALLEPGKPLFNTAAPARRQMPQPEPKPHPAIAPNYGKRQLAITAANCITPVGHNAEMTAASVRAGICRFRISEDYQDRNGNPITVAKIKGVKDDVGNVVERIREIAEICLDDLLDQYLSHTGVSAGVSPSGGGAGGGHPLQAHFLLSAASGNRAGVELGEESMIALKHAIAERFANSPQEIIAQGNAALHQAIGHAARVVAGHPQTLCIIGCVDSLHHESILDSFEENGRLKSASYGRHSGLIASESVCFLIVEDLEQAVKNGRPPLARITALGLAEEPHPRASNQPSGFSKGLTEACQAALEPLADQEVKAVFGDLNGEDSRAEEWGVVCQRSFEKDQNPPFWTPADTYGDIGAAAGGVMACIVAEGFKRNWLPSPVMIFCSDDFGPCGAVVLEKELQKEEEKTRPKESAQAERPMTYRERKLADLKETNH